ncbi:MAG: phage major capsid protein [Motiliproteus sp.]|nr:phage major capsid protein [Motiliproteus sp.]
MTTDVKAAVDSLNKEVTDFINKSNEEMETNSKLGRANKEALAKLEDQCGEIGARMLEMEQAATAQAGAAKPELSAGMQFAESDSFKSMQNGLTKSARFHVQNNTITGSDTTVAPDRYSGIIAPANRILRISDVLPSGLTTSNAIEYTKEATFVDNAAETAEGGTKPESDVTFTLESAPVATIAHWIKLSKQVIDDAPMLASHVDGRMRYGVLRRLDTQLLLGNGTGANIGGLMKSGNYTVFTPVASSNKMENIRRAITAVLQSDYAPTAVILNPADCEDIDLDQGSDNHFRAADPRKASPRTIWGLPIVESNAMNDGQFLVGAFDMAAQVWNRQGMTVDLSESDDTNFQTNLVTLRAEMRTALTVYRPASIVGGAITA